MRDKVVLVTGAGGGLGRSISLAAVERGASTVVMTDVNAEVLADAAEELKRAGGNALRHSLNVTSESGWQEMLHTLDAAGVRPQVLINNAGITHRAGIDSSTLDDWHRVMDVNVTGTFLGMKHVAPRVRDAGGGAIVNVSSIAGLTGYFSAPYTASKWAVRGLTRTAAVEYAPWGIRVNCVCPGFVETPLTAGVATMTSAFAEGTAMRRLCTPEEVAMAVTFLASRESSYITGTDMLLDGGYLAGSHMSGLAKLL